jgi:hypothetical protein
MGKEPFFRKIKRLIYYMVLPIYLWSIDQKTLDDYLIEIERQFIQRADMTNSTIEEELFFDTERGSL